MDIPITQRRAQIMKEKRESLKNSKVQSKISPLFQNKLKYPKGETDVLEAWQKKLKTLTADGLVREDVPG
jgi:hypothetical protein